MLPSTAFKQARGQLRLILSGIIRPQLDVSLSFPDGGLSVIVIPRSAANTGRSAATLTATKNLEITYVVSSIEGARFTPYTVWVTNSGAFADPEDSHLLRFEIVRPGADGQYSATFRVRSGHGASTVTREFLIGEATRWL